MSPPRRSKPTPPGTSAYRHTAASRRNQPTVDTEPLMSNKQRAPLPFHIDRRQITHPVLAWDRQGHTSRMEGDPTADATHGFAGVPLYTQEKINPLTMIEQLRKPDTGTPLNLFADFNGLPPDANTWEFYQHAGHWQNRLIHGDSSEVLQSLISRDGLAGRVQMVYFDPPYGISFRSNFMTATDRLQTKDTITEGVGFPPYRGGLLLEEELMSEIRRRYDPEFKSGAVRIVLETGKPIARVARDLGLQCGYVGELGEAAACFPGGKRAAGRGRLG